MLKRLGLRPDWLYRRLGLKPMRLRFLPEPAVRDHLAALGVRVLHARTDRQDWGADLAQRLRLVTESGITSATYYATALGPSDKRRGS